jgi:sugar-phosphatase
VIKAVIFDMDGLLIDSEPFWRRSHQVVLARHGYDVTEDEVRAAAGKRTADQVAVWRERFGFHESLDPDMTDQIVDEVISSIHTHGEPMAGVDKLVRELHEHGMPLAVASSSSVRLIDVVLERLGIRQYMQAVHSGENEKRGKPHPDVFITTAKTLGVKPENCLVFEDSLNGVKAAKAAGMYCIAVPEEPYERADFIAAKADRVISSLEDIHWSDLQI